MFIFQGVCCFRLYSVVNADTFDLLAASGLFRCTESWQEKGREKLPFNISHIVHQKYQPRVTHLLFKVIFYFLH